MQRGQKKNGGESMCGGTLAGVDQLFYDWLELDTGRLVKGISADYGNTPAVAREICRQGPPEKSPPITEAFQAIQGNLDGALKAGGRPPTESNYRWEKQLNMQAHNSGEKRLEKLAACILGDDWVNQVPVCSGFTWAREGGRAIDLARKVSESECQFIELKYAGQNSGRAGGADHPLYAAMELLQYGLVFLMARKRSLIKAGGTRMYLNNVEKIQLVVLAPKEFYDGFEMQWLPRVVNGGLAELRKQEELPVEMSLRFDVLSEEFISFYHQLEDLMDDLRIVYENANIKSNDPGVDLAQSQTNFRRLFPEYKNHFS
ncbi:hypothetical protein [Rosistilla oblonga]|uniref:hypothetical protein n=1 Tax=Rosistilla oblonga TaxID=2527990 RepID=UPI003A979CFA